MNLLIFNILFFLFLPIFSYGTILDVSIFQPDSIPPPPPGQSISLTGPSSACTGDTSVYFTDVPVACNCQWAVNGAIQPDTGSTFSITWEEPGSYIVTLLFICAGGQTTEPNAILTEVTATPDVFLGNDTILGIGQTILLDAGNPGSNYLWSTGATTQTILVSVSGNYSVTVTNNCGADQDAVEVTILVGVTESATGVPFEVILSGRKLRIKGLTQKIKRMEVYDLAGKTVYSGTLLEEVSISEPGIYILKLISPGNVMTVKFLSP